MLSLALRSAVAILIAGYKYLTRVDRTNAVQVATAFTKALKSKDVSTAANYFEPAGAEAWTEGFGGMRSGATERFYERVPSDPQFGAVETSTKGVTTIQSADKSYTLEMKQIDGKWFVSKVPS